VIDLACTDVVVSGTLQVNSGQLSNVRSLTINPGGAIDGGSGLIEVAGNWTNSGTFIAGTGTVNFRDLCSFGNAVVMGSTTVGVTDVWATGQWLAPFLTNEGGSGNAQRWFGVPDSGGVAAIPTLDAAALFSLAALLAAIGLWSLKRRGVTRPARTNGE
jgi:hypothetical protein